MRAMAAALITVVGDMPLDAEEPLVVFPEGIGRGLLADAHGLSFFLMQRFSMASLRKIGRAHI